MDDAARALITESLDEAIEQATTEDGISPGTDLHEDDEARHHIGEQALMYMTDLYEDLPDFTRALDTLIAEYMAGNREDFPTTTDELLTLVQGNRLGLSDLGVLALGYRAAERFKR